MRQTDDAWKPFSELRGFVRLVLLVDWDPIGILGYAGAMDEYDSYVESVCRLIEFGADREKLKSHLDELERVNMGLRGNHQVQGEVADKLLGLYRRVQQDNQRRSVPVKDS